MIVSGPDDNSELIRRILGPNYLELRLTRLQTEEVPELAARIVVEVAENGAAATIEGEGVGPIDALWGVLVGRYAREYQSLKSLELAGFTVSAAIESKRRRAGLDALARVELAPRAQSLYATIGGPLTWGAAGAALAWWLVPGLVARVRRRRTA